MTDEEIENESADMGDYEWCSTCYTYVHQSEADDHDHENDGKWERL